MTQEELMTLSLPAAVAQNVKHPVRLMKFVIRHRSITPP